MSLPPDSYVDSMPCDEDLLAELGRVTWAAARLHAAVRDAINLHDGRLSDEPFTTTLGNAVKMLEGRARATGRSDQLDWIDQAGRPAVRMRNAVVHAVAYTAKDGKQAIRTSDHSSPGRYLNDQLRQVSLHLINASMALPR